MRCVRIEHVSYIIAQWHPSQYTCQGQLQLNKSRSNNYGKRRNEISSRNNCFVEMMTISHDHPIVVSAMSASIFLIVIFSFRTCRMTSAYSNEHSTPVHDSRIKQKWSRSSWKIKKNLYWNGYIILSKQLLYWLNVVFYF